MEERPTALLGSPAVLPKSVWREHELLRTSAGSDSVAVRLHRGFGRRQSLSWTPSTIIQAQLSQLEEPGPPRVL